MTTLTHTTWPRLSGYRKCQDAGTGGGKQAGNEWISSSYEETTIMLFSSSSSSYRIYITGSDTAERK